ncbi:FkbM family methyltransferase [bacterium]|nr:FkbM family methyltransferase [bacterium]
MNKLFGKYYIVSYGTLGKYLYDFFKSDTNLCFMGFLDNIKTGENVFRPEIIIDKDSIAVIASINYMYDLTHQLKALGFKNVITFADLTLMYPELQNFNQAFLGLKEDYKNNKEKYEQVRNILADEKSKEVLDTIIEFRKTYNIDLYSKIADDINREYFEDFMPKDEKIFIDGGAFDGDTVLRAVNCGYKFEKIYFFEPDKNSLSKAKENLKDFSNIKYLPYGISDKNKVLNFDSNGTFGSHFSEAGEDSIECVSLDDTVKEDRAFIKLDIEGAEIEAINGAKRLLKNGSPFAICVYHKPEDIWKIPELLLNIIYGKTLDNSVACLEALNYATTQLQSLKQFCTEDLDYKFFLRHYTNTIFDTILYGVPK